MIWSIRWTIGSLRKCLIDDWLANPRLKKRRPRRYTLWWSSVCAVFASLCSERDTLEIPWWTELTWRHHAGCRRQEAAIRWKRKGPLAHFSMAFPLSTGSSTTTSLAMFDVRDQLHRLAWILFNIPTYLSFSLTLFLSSSLSLFKFTVLITEIMRK